MYSFDVDEELGCRVVTISGFFSAGEMAAYETDMRGIAAPPGKPPTICLIDGTGFSVQSQEVFEKLERLGHVLGGRVRPIVVLSSALARMQAGRVDSQRADRLFTSVDDAKAYIRSLPR